MVFRFQCPDLRDYDLPIFSNGARLIVRGRSSRIQVKHKARPIGPFMLRLVQEERPSSFHNWNC